MDLKRNFQIPDHCMSVINNPTDLNKIRELAGRHSKKEFNASKISLVFVGSLLKRKSSQSY